MEWCCRVFRWELAHLKKATSSAAGLPFQRRWAPKGWQECCWGSSWEWLKQQMAERVPAEHQEPPAILG